VWGVSVSKGAWGGKVVWSEGDSSFFFTVGKGKTGWRGAGNVIIKRAEHYVKTFIQRIKVWE